MFGFFQHGMGPQANFQADYKVYPVSFIDKLDAENGDKVFMPPSALHRLSEMNLEYPMLFNVSNSCRGRVTHCGVLEFIAEEGIMYMPYWMMQNLVLQEGDTVRLRSVPLPKGTYVKLQPHTTDFINISNPKAVLETTLRGYTCLTVGDAICVYYNNRKYFIDVVEAKPPNPHPGGANAISVVDTDCEVDFAQPLDYVEPERLPPPSAQAAAAAAGGGAGPAPEAAPEAPEDPKFMAFTGRGRRADDKELKYADSPVAVPLNNYQGGWRSAAESLKAVGMGPEVEEAEAKAKAAAAAAGDGKKAGKVVFGSGNRLTAKKDKPPAKPREDPKPDDGPKFSAFGGKPNKLR